MINNVFLVTNTSCNQNCSYCYYRNKILSNVKGFLDGEALEKFLDEPVDRISITGGEPLLNPFFQKYLRIANKVAKKISLSTNGKLLNADLVKKLYKNRILKIFISLDSIKNNSQEKLRGNAKSQVLRSIKLLKKTPIKIIISCVITTQNLVEIFDLQRFCINNGLQFWPQPVFFEKKNKLSLANTKKEKWQEIIKSIPDDLKNAPVASFLKKYYSIFVIKKNTSKHCPFFNNQIVINTNGDIQKCFFSKPIGNIKNSKISQIKFKKEGSEECFKESCLQYIL